METSTLRLGTWERLGAEQLPGHHMMDIDPMVVRRCPENAVAHDGSDLVSYRS